MTDNDNIITSTIKDDTSKINLLGKSKEEIEVIKAISFDSHKSILDLDKDYIDKYIKSIGLKNYIEFYNKIIVPSKKSTQDNNEVDISTYINKFRDENVNTIKNISNNNEGTNNSLEVNTDIIDNLNKNLDYLSENSKILNINKQSIDNLKSDLSHSKEVFASESNTNYSQKIDKSADIMAIDSLVRDLMPNSNKFIQEDSGDKEIKFNNALEIKELSKNIKNFSSNELFSNADTLPNKNINHPLTSNFNTENEYKQENKTGLYSSIVSYASTDDGIKQLNNIRKNILNDDSFLINLKEERKREIKTKFDYPQTDTKFINDNRLQEDSSYGLKEISHENKNIDYLNTEIDNNVMVKNKPDIKQSDIIDNNAAYKRFDANSQLRSSYVKNIGSNKMQDVENVESNKYISNEKFISNNSFIPMNKINEDNNSISPSANIIDPNRYDRDINITLNLGDEVLTKLTAKINEILNHS